MPAQCPFPASATKHIYENHYAVIRKAQVNLLRFSAGITPLAGQLLEPLRARYNRRNFSVFS